MIRVPRVRSGNGLEMERCEATIAKHTLARAQHDVENDAGFACAQWQWT